jgi:AraC-like DNA-binding protein
MAKGYCASRGWEIVADYVEPGVSATEFQRIIGQAAGVRCDLTAERTLRASCEEHLGVGPIRFLALRRMHLAHRALLRTDPPKSTITRTVTDHGFWELGRFSIAYRALFGEPPSQTLQRLAEQLELDPRRPLFTGAEVIE